MESIDAGAVATWLEGQASHLLFSVSYEPRSAIIREKVAASGVKLYGFFNENHSYLDQEVTTVKQRAPLCEFVPLNSDKPLQTFDKMRAFVRATFPTKVAVAVDITCFTREALAMLLVILHHDLPAGSSILCLYTTAKDYPEGPKGSEFDGWLSHGIADIRSVLAYRGNVSLLAKTHLILFPGFEVERAHSIVDTLQANRITIGEVAEGHSIQPHFMERCVQMTQRLEAYYPEQRLEHVPFSPRDPFWTRDQLLQRVRTDENTVVACMNSKVAMAGVCMAALACPSIQLIYAQPVSYNTRHCATPGGAILSFKFAM